MVSPSSQYDHLRKTLLVVVLPSACRWSMCEASNYLFPSSLHTWGRLFFASCVTEDKHTATSTEILSQRYEMISLALNTFGVN
jgi:hypothetical protein